MMAVAKQTEQTNQNCLQNGQQGGQLNSAQNCCAGCQMPIKDRFIFSVIEQNFHQDCVRCVDCSSNLNERCYTFEGKLYCRVDYWRRFGPKCSACQEPIKPTELVQRLKKNLVYHLNCFVCQDCKRHLQAGEQLHLIDDKRLLCKQDFIAAAQQQAATSTSSSSRSSAILAATSIISTNNHQTTAPTKANNLNGNSQQGRGHLAPTNKSSNNNQENEVIIADNMSSASNASEQHLTAGALGGSMLGDDGDDMDDLDDQSSTADGDTGERPGCMRFAGHYVPGGQQPGSAKGTDELLKSNGLVDCGDDLVDANGKRRGPRTTIKPKQLETLRQAFDDTPKPSRHVREQLALKTGLNMRVIQVWFQNRRSKERRMKNSGGGARRNFFRSSSRRLRVGPNAPASNGPATGVGAQQQQQSLIAGGRTGSKQKQQQPQPQQQQQLSPLDSTDQMLAGGQLHGRQHNSPSEFGGSSSGGFTYFSDSSNQGETFAINQTGHHQQQQQQSQSQTGQPQPSSQAPTQQQQQQYLANGPPDQGSLIALESPSAGQHNRMDPNGQQHQQQAARTQQQQYGHQQMKNTPPPPPHMMMGGLPPHGSTGPPTHPSQMGHPHQHLGVGGQMMQPGPGMGIGVSLLGHPQGPSVVQW